MKNVMNNNSMKNVMNNNAMKFVKSVKNVLFGILCIVFFILFILKINFEEKFENNQKVILSMTTNPTRIKNISKVLDSIDLTLVDIIQINLPLKFRNEYSYDQNDIVNLQKLNDKIKIRIFQEDLGPIMKIIPTLETYTDPNAVVVVIDDDILYNNYLIKRLLESINHDPNKVYSGKIFKLGDYNISKFANHFTAFIAEGWTSIAFKRSLITNEMIQEMKYITNLNNFCKLSDDFVFSYVLNNVGIKVSSINLIPDFLDYAVSDSFSLYKGSGLSNDELNKFSSSDYFDKNMLKYDMCYASIKN